MITAPSSTEQLRLFALRSRDLAGRVFNGSLRFIEAVDIGYEAAVWSGLVDLYGDDAVQEILADAFLGFRERRG